jgi:hypothetical protein
VYSHYTIFVAEVASTLNEALLTNYMQQQAKEQGDRALQLYLLNSYAERFRTTLVSPDDVCRIRADDSPDRLNAVRRSRRSQ